MAGAKVPLEVSLTCMTLDWDFSWALTGKHRRGLFMLSELSHSMAAGVQEGAPQEKEVEEHRFFFLMT